MSLTHRVTAPLRHLAGLFRKSSRKGSTPRPAVKRSKKPSRRRTLPSAPKHQAARQDGVELRQRGRAAKQRAARKAVHASKYPPLKRWGKTPPPPPVRWVVDRLILAGAFNVIAGAPGVGKTSLTMHLAACVAAGQPFLDRPTEQGTVFFINLDDPNEAVSRRFFEMACNALGRAPQSLDVYHWNLEMNAPALDGESNDPYLDLEAEPAIQELCAQLREHEPTLVIIDSYSAAFPRADGNRADHIMRTDRVLRRLMRETSNRAAIVIIDHTPKPNGNDAKGMRRGVSGSQQKHARARTVHLVMPGEPLDEDVDLLEWSVYKSNASPAGYVIGIQRVLDESRGTLTFTPTDLPDLAQPKRGECHLAILGILRNDGDVVKKKDLIARVRSIIDVSERTARSVLESDPFTGHPNVEKVRLKGRGSPVGYRWIERD